MLEWFICGAVFALIIPTTAFIIWKLWNLFKIDANADKVCKGCADLESCDRWCKGKRYHKAGDRYNVI